MLVHICCSVDCDYFLFRLKQDYPNDEIIGLFYDPNIHPYSEFLLRYKDTQKICKKYDIKLLCGEYDFENWLKGTSGLEFEPEKGKRCSYCFDFRFASTANLAKNLGQNLITTTLLMSPKKEFSQLISSMEKICQINELKFIAPDYRKFGGTNEQMKMARNDRLYHQNYCGCMFGLNLDNRAKMLYELQEPISKQIQFNSPKYRLNLYKKVYKFEKKGIKFNLEKYQILNYRLKKAFVRMDGKICDSYFLFYSLLNRKKSNFILQNLKPKEQIYRHKKDEIVFIDLAKFNELTSSNYKSVREIYFNALKLKKELNLRQKINSNSYDLGVIVVLDEIKPAKFEVFCDAQIYSDTIQKISQNI